MIDTTNTSNYQYLPNFVYDIKELDDIKRIRKEKDPRLQTNPLVKYFKQVQYTAHNPYYFYKYSIYQNKNIEKTINIVDYDNIYNNEYNNTIIHHKYDNINVSDVYNTFKYIFYKFKKGIFVSIRDNKLTVFLPFSNIDYTNEWHENIIIDPAFKKIQLPKGINKSNIKDIKLYNFLNLSSKESGYDDTDPKRINYDISKWYGNGGLVRFENPIHENDKGVGILKDMLLELCNSRELPDIDFFVNKRDNPILKNNETEAYDEFFGRDVDLVSHNYMKYCPIFSYSSDKNRFADILIPNWEDWQVCNPDKYFIDSIYKEKVVSIPWEEKKSIAIFRGSSTGKGTNIYKNMRLKVSHMSNSEENFSNVTNLPYIDAGITKWNTRPRKTEDSIYMSSIERNDKYNKPYLTPQRQSDYKYIINIDGHVSAFRLSHEFSYGSVILIVDSDYKLWFSHLLKPYVHYIPVNRDLSNLFEVVEWCQKNDGKCKIIAKNSLEFFNKYLSKESQLDFLQYTISKVSEKSGKYEYFSDFDLTNLNSNYLETPIYKLMNRYKSEEREIVSDEKLFDRYEKFLSKFYKNTYAFYEFLCGEIERYPENINFVKLLNNTNLKRYKKDENFINEYNICKNCLNPLRKNIYNFTYLFHSYSNNLSLIENYDDSITLHDYIYSKNFDTIEFIKIFMEICLALQIAQDKYLFVHNNLVAKNIDLSTHMKNKSVIYSFIFRSDNICSNYIDSYLPLIKNFTSCYYVYNNTQYDNTTESLVKFNYSDNLDYFTLYEDCIEHIYKSYKSGNFKLTRKDIEILCLLPKTVYEKNLNDINELYNFITNEDREIKIIDTRPLNIFYIIYDYLDTEIINDRFVIDYKYTDTSYGISINSKIYKYLLNDDNYYNSFIKYYDDLIYKSCSNPYISNDLLKIYYLTQYTYLTIKEVKKLIMEQNFTKEENVELDKKYNICINILYKIFNEKVKFAKIETYLDELVIYNEYYGISNIDVMIYNDINNFNSLIEYINEPVYNNEIESLFIIKDILDFDENDEGEYFKLIDKSVIELYNAIYSKILEKFYHIKLNKYIYSLKNTLINNMKFLLDNVDN